MQPKEQRIEHTLQSLTSVKRAEVSAALHNRVMDIINGARVKVMTISPVTFWRVAAAIILLVGLNVFSIANYSGKSHAGNKTNIFAQEYFSYTKTAAF